MKGSQEMIKEQMWALKQRRGRRRGVKWEIIPILHEHNHSEKKRSMKSTRTHVCINGHFCVIWDLWLFCLSCVTCPLLTACIQKQVNEQPAGEYEKVATNLKK